MLLPFLAGFSDLVFALIFAEVAGLWEEECAEPVIFAEVDEVFACDWPNALPESARPNANAGSGQKD